MSMIKRNPSLSEQAKAHIKGQILANQYSDGRIPSESDLADELGVSRTTIRDALSRLEIEGSVYRRQGSGTFVNEPGLQIKSRLDEIWSYEEILEAHGYTPSTEVLDIKEESPDNAVIAALDLGPDETVTVIRKLFTEDKEPVIFIENQIPTRLCGDAITPEQCRLPVFEFVESICHERLNFYLSEIVPVSTTKKLAETLDIPRGKAIISLEETGYNDENVPILWAKSFFRDDLLRFRLIRRGV